MRVTSLTYVNDGAGNFFSWKECQTSVVTFSPLGMKEQGSPFCMWHPSGPCCYGNGDGQAGFPDTQGLPVSTGMRIGTAQALKGLRALHKGAH